MPQCNYYKPRGVPLSTLAQVTIAVDEMEAIRLADYEGLYHAEAAERMGVSRQTFGRILDSAHRKIADALTNGKALAIEGGPYQLDPDVAQQNDGPPYRCRRGRGGRHGHGQGPPPGP